MLEFGQPAALWTGLAIGLPILAHMAYRRITEKHAFSSIRFITPSQIPRTGRRTPTDLLLLLLRILLFVAVTMLLADPFLSSPEDPKVTTNAQETLLAVDLSPSMAGWNGLRDAKKRLKIKLQDAEGKFGMISFGQNGLKEWPIGTSVEELLKSLEQLEHGWMKGDAQSAIQRIPTFFSNEATKKILVIASDFQKSDWQGADINLPREGIEVEIIKVGQGDEMTDRAENLSIADARVVPAGPDRVRIWSVVRNWSKVNRDVVLELIVGGKIEDNASFLVPASGSAQAQFILPSSEISQATVRLSKSDSLNLDNQRQVWLKAPPAKGFGFWNSGDEDEETQMEKNFLRTAVESAGDNGWNRWAENSGNADELRMGEENSNLEFLMILGMGKWFEAEQLSDPLDSYLRNGGVVMITPNNIFGETASVIRKAGWFNFSFVRVAGGANSFRNPFRIGALSEESVLSQVFSGKGGRDLYLTAIRKFGILKNLGDEVDVPLRDREGRPLALLRNFDSGGRLIFMPFRMNTEWSDLPLRTSFLPVLMEISHGNEDTEQTLPILEPGERYGESDQQFTATQPGIHRFGERWLEVVFPPAESSVDTISENELKDMLKGGLVSDSLRFSRSEVGKKEHNSLWLWFAILAATFLTIEMIWSRPPYSSNQEKGISNA